MAIDPDLLDLFPDVIIMQATTADRYGALTPVSDPVEIPCYISGDVREIKTREGATRISTVQATLAGVFDATPDHTYTLPSRFVPQNPTPIAVQKFSDEDGPHHEVVLFT